MAPGLSADLPPDRRFAPIGGWRAALGALVGIATTSVVCRLLTPAAAPALVPAMGASAVLLFAAPYSPLARPWPALGGNIVSAVVGVACAALIPEPTLAAAVAVSGAVAVMGLLRCTHPPGGAIALVAVAGGPELRALGFGFVLSPVALSTVVIFVVSRAFLALTPRD